MQIIGGKLKGKKLAKCKSRDIRPAMALTRKSIFDTLREQVDSANVLDLFSGSGIVGIEALSRGAKSLTLVDSSKTAIDLIKKNLILCNLQAKVILGKLPDVLNKHNLTPGQYDLIFIDPPYAISDIIINTLETISLNKLLKNSGIIIIESEQRTNFKIPPGFSQVKEKTFGNTRVSFLSLAL